MMLVQRKTELLEDANRFQNALVHLRFEGKPCLGRNIHQARALFTELSREVSAHILEEKKTLFPFLLQHVPKLEMSIRLFEAEHKEFLAQLRLLEKCFEQIGKSKDGETCYREAGRVLESGSYLVCLLRHHLQAEDATLYTAVSNDLNDEEKDSLNRQLAEENRHDEHQRNKRAY